MEADKKREDEMKTIIIEEPSNNNNNNNNDLEKSSSRLWSLLASKDRDFLLTSNDTQVKISELEGKVVGIYFSANWFPPCQKFNDLLINVYQQLKGQGSDFEIIFVSSDEDVIAFNDYRATLPWLSVPFSDLETRRALSKVFDVEGIPCLVVLQPKRSEHDDDNGVLYDGVELIYRYGTRVFPFTKEKLEELKKEEWEREEKQTLINLLTNHDRDYVLGHPPLDKVPVTFLEDKTIGLYFSAQWSQPCVKFTPKLISIYEKIKQGLREHNKEDFEIVFVSSDKDQESFNSYSRSMPWLTLPYNDPTAKDLAKHFDVCGIPSLIILGSDGKTVTTQGRYLINLYQENAYPFTKERVELLEKKMDEEAKTLPKSMVHLGHQHELNLVSQENGGGPYICCQCNEQGCGWAYQCLECGYEVHTKCVRPIGDNT